MKLVRFGPVGRERPGIIDAEGRVRDLSGVADDIAGAALTPDGLALIASQSLDGLPSVDPETVRFGPCVGAVGKILAVGRNYHDHASETGNKVSEEPMIFSKATSAICGAFDDLILPPGAEQVDWEVELGVVIGTTTRYIDATEALSRVAGYCVVNDVSERHFQRNRSGQFIKGKSADSFAPLGPWFVSADAVADPQALKLWLDVDGTRMQDGTTADMVFSVAHVVAHLSEFMTLHPGDVIATGTPAGVGAGRTPPVFLEPGQIVEAGVEGLGQQRMRTVAYGA